MPIAEALPTNKIDSEEHSARQPIPINCWPYIITFSLLPLIYLDGLEFRSPSTSLMVIGFWTEGSPSKWLRVVNPYIGYTTVGYLADYTEAMLDSETMSYIVGDLL